MGTLMTVMKNGEDSQLWNVIGFAEAAVAELSRLCEGEAVAVQGIYRRRTRE
jgi:hypothetical protein